MFDPRIYRTGLVAVVLAAIVFAFSLQNQPGALNATVTPDAFAGSSAYDYMTSLAAQYPHRPAGSASDDAVGAAVARQLRSDAFDVSTQSFSAATPAGRRTLENVIGVRSGLMSGSIVVVAHRDATGAPATAQASGTGVLMELASVLSEETLRHTIVLASTSGSTGAAGVTQLIRSLPGPVDAVLVLGDMASPTLREPLVVPWSTGEQLAPPVLRNTVAAALSSEAGIAAGGTTSFAGQLAHLAFPLTVSDQGVFNARGIPAVLLSSAGELPSPDNQVPSAAQINQFGRVALQTIGALDSGGTIARPSAYLEINGDLVPAWAVRLLVLTLILPVLMATIDGFARARRRSHEVGKWVWWILAAGVPFVLAAAIVLIAKLAGLLAIAPPAPVAPGAVPLGAGGIALLVIAACVIVLGTVLIRRRWSAAPGREGGAGPGAAAALLLVMCALALVIWVSNPFTALLMVPALHLWLWAVAPDGRMHPTVRLGMLVLGLVPPVLVIAYYMSTLGFGPVAFAWAGVLMVAGGHISLLSVLEWSFALGCAVSVFTVAAWSMRRVRVPELPVTVRGPVTYAGPGSLGGTESALRR